MNILIADIQDITRIGARTIVKSLFPAGDVVVMDVDNNSAFLDALAALKPAVVMFDAVAMGMDLNNTLKDMAAKYPDTQWIIFSARISVGLLSFMSDHKMFSAVPKDSSKEEIAESIKAATKKEQYIFQKGLRALYDMSKGAEASSALLTASECDILKLLAQGLKVKDIAEIQNRSRHTIRTHKRNIFAKLKVNSVVGAIKTAKGLNLI